jgi:TM2 domain-containing membrane protein YozV
MKPIINSIILVICLTLVASLNSKVNTLNKNLSNEKSTNLIQAKTVEKLETKVNTKENSKLKNKQAPVTAAASANVSANTNKPATTTTTPTTTTSSNITVEPPTTNPDEKFNSAPKIACTSTNCPLPYGTCQENNSSCRCMPEYANFTPEGVKDANYCNYPRKKQLVAFLLEFFFTFGIGHFYAGRVGFGVAKLIVLLLPVIGYILMCASVVAKDTGNCLGLVAVIITYGFCCAGSIWQLVDIILFGINNYKDGYGVPLLHW